MKTARELEMERLYDAVAGENWIADEQRMLFVCLTGADPKDACRMTYEPFDAVGGKIPASYKNSAMALYKIAGSELNKFSSQRLCAAIESFLGTVMTASELAAFKANTPMKYPIKQYKNILEEMADYDPSVAAVVGKAIAVVVRSPRRGEPRAGRATRYFGTRARANHRCASAKKETSIYGRCWCKGHTTFWDLLGKTVTCVAGGGSSRREEGKSPRNGRWWR